MILKRKEFSSIRKAKKLAKMVGKSLIKDKMVGSSKPLPKTLRMMKKVEKFKKPKTEAGRNAMDKMVKSLDLDKIAKPYYRRHLLETL